MHVLRTFLLLRHISYVREGEGSTLLTFEGEVTIEVGDSTTGASFLHDGSADDGLTGLVDDGTGEQNVLGPRHDTA